jgi:outer membrane lipoprotein SlyB
VAGFTQWLFPRSQRRDRGCDGHCCAGWASARRWVRRQRNSECRVASGEQLRYTKYWHRRPSFRRLGIWRVVSMGACAGAPKRRLDGGARGTCGACGRGTSCRRTRGTVAARPRPCRHHETDVGAAVKTAQVADVVMMRLCACAGMDHQHGSRSGTMRARRHGRRSSTRHSRRASARSSGRQSERLGERAPERTVGTTIGTTVGATRGAHVATAIGATRGADAGRRRGRRSSSRGGSGSGRKRL